VNLPKLKLQLASKVSGQYHPGDELFLNGVKEAQLTESTPGAFWALVLMLLTIVCGVTWAAMAHVDEITKADARVVPDGREQVIASLEGGLLAAMLVHEGDIVEIGQDLVHLDPTRFEAQQNEGQAKRLALKATIARLTAESSGRPLVFPEDVRALPAMVQGETDSYNARRQALEEGVASTRRSLSMLNVELSMSERLSAKGLVSDVEVFRLKRQANDLQTQIEERRVRFRQEAAAELVRNTTELSQIEEQMIARQDVVRRTTLKSPVRGIVKNIRMGTLGGVVQGGAPILEIVPITTGVLVEARVKPADIAFVHVGLETVVKLSAYDFNTFGGLKGKITYLSPDALGDDPRVSPSQDNSYYRALVRCEKSDTIARGKPLAILPGMTASVEIRTGERTVLQFLLSPMMKSREAFREK
jgi:adhesin transport system membrane fusion protein